MGEIMTTISAKELAKKEGIGMDALRARWNTLCAERPDIFRERWDKNRPINFAQETALRSAKSAAKKGRTKRENPGVTSEPARAEVSAPIAPADVPESFLHTKWALYSGMVVCMISQMIHTAGFFFINSPIEQHEVRLALCILFALGVDSTALILTIRRGGKIYLWTFAVCHFLMNVTFHVQAHEFDLSLSAMVGIFGYLLLSFVIAYANFSYTDLFSHKKTSI